MCETAGAAAKGLPSRSRQRLHTPRCMGAALARGRPGRRETGHSVSWGPRHQVHRPLCSAPAWSAQRQYTGREVAPATFDPDNRRAARRLPSVPSTQLVEKKAMFLVSSGFSLVKSGDLVCGSDSPVSEELSTCRRGKAGRVPRALASPRPGQAPATHLRLAAATHLAAVGRYDSEVSRDAVTALHFHQVPDDDFLRIDAHLLAVSNHQCLLWRQTTTVGTVKSDKSG